MIPSVSTIPKPKAAIRPTTLSSASPSRLPPKPTTTISSMSPNRTVNSSTTVLSSTPVRATLKPSLTSTPNRLPPKPNTTVTSSTPNKLPPKPTTGTKPPSKRATVAQVPAESTAPATSAKARVPTAKEIMAKAKADEEARKAEEIAMDQEIESLKAEIMAHETFLEENLSEVERVEKRVEELSLESEQQLEKKHHLVDELERKRAEWTENLNEYQAELTELEEIVEKEQEAGKRGQKELSSIAKEIDEIKELVLRSNEENLELREELSNLTAVLDLKSAKEIKRLARLDLLMKELTSIRDVLDGKLPDVTVTNVSSSSDGTQTKQYQLESFIVWDDRRKRLHTLAQDLRGSMRVICRIRPPSGSEADEPILQTSLSKDASQIVVKTPASRDVTGMSEYSATHQFTFDRIFNGKTSQSLVFEEISQVVESALDGDNVAILAYGQTGSGKTYTMEGATAMQGNNTMFGLAQDVHRGVIPRSVEMIFLKLKEMVAMGWSFEVRLSSVEVYNEKVTDLLGKEPGGAPPPKGEEGGTSFEVRTEQDVYNYLSKASKSRTVAATNANQHSSRSHYLCYFKISAKRDGHEDRKGSLCFVDLAGSERISQTGATGERLKEGACINQSLTTLRNVFSLLVAKSKSKSDSVHVPYRNSKLTMLLKSCLEDKGKTLMFINCSPLQKHMNETISSFKFAESVSSVKQQSGGRVNNGSSDFSHE